WCGTVGPTVVEQSLLAADAQNTDSLAIITWNTHVGAGDIGALVSDLRSGAVTDGVPVRDFVLLRQEVYRTGGEIPGLLYHVGVPGRIAPLPPTGKRIEVVQSARDAALNIFYVRTMRNGARLLPLEDRGNAILSTIRLHDLNAIELPLERQRRVAARGAARSHSNRADVLSKGLRSRGLQAAVAARRCAWFARRRCSVQRRARTAQLQCACPWAAAVQCAQALLRDRVIPGSPRPCDTPPAAAA